MSENKNATPKAWADPDDAPELTEAFFKRADEYDGVKRVKRGRPPKPNAKVAVKLRLDPDVLEVLKATGPGWQTRANLILRDRFML